MRSETEAAITAAEIAQRIADSREGANDVTSKSGIDLVTGTDIACEDAIRGELSRRFDYPVIGEERGGSPGSRESYWLVDPICGTRPFASNIPLYCSNIALVESGVVTVAAVAIGRTGEIVYAERGKGARMRARSGDAALRAGTESNTIWIDGKDERAAKAIHDALLLRRWYVWLFSSTLSYAYVAAGRMSGLIHFGTPAADTFGSVHNAAGCLVAAEAGAIVTDLDTGKEWNLNSSSLLIASSRELHDELSGVLNQRQPEERS
jgi:myo-inositol-1(or 4)-monophosphatase